VEIKKKIKLNKQTNTMRIADSLFYDFDLKHSKNFLLSFLTFRSTLQFDEYTARRKIKRPE